MERLNVGPDTSGKTSREAGTPLHRGLDQPPIGVSDSGVSAETPYIPGNVVVLEKTPGPRRPDGPWNGYGTA